MIIIGICDGEQAIRSLLASYVERYRVQYCRIGSACRSGVVSEFCANYRK